MLSRSLPPATGPAFIGNEVADVEGSGIHRRRRRPRGVCGVESGVLKEGGKVVRRVVQLATLLDPFVKVDVSNNIGTKYVPVSMIRGGGTTRGRAWAPTMAIIGEWSDDSSNTDSTRI
jgi:hypothetical protein